MLAIPYAALWYVLPVLISIIVKIGIAHRQRSAFPLSALNLCLWFLAHYMLGLYWLCAATLVYIALDLYTYRKWSREERDASR